MIKQIDERLKQEVERIIEKKELSRQDYDILFLEYQRLSTISVNSMFMPIVESLTTKMAGV